MKYVAVKMVSLFALAGAGVAYVAASISELVGGPWLIFGKHHDYLAFYSAAALTLRGHIDGIYTASAITAFERTIVPSPVGAAGYMPFMNPPFVAVWLAPLGLLPAESAHIVWFLLNLVVVMVLSGYIVRPLKNGWLRAGAAVLLVASFPVYHALIEGQVSIVMVAGLIAAIMFYRHGRVSLAGAALVTLLIKPQLLVLALVGLILFREWRMLRGLILACATVVATSMPFTGLHSYLQFIEYSLHAASAHATGAGAVGDAAWKGSVASMVGFNGLVTSIVGQQQTFLVNGLTILLDVLFAGAYIGMVMKRKIWQAHGRTKTVVACLGIVVAMLINPHAYAQDAVLFYAVPALLLPYVSHFKTILWFALVCDLLVIDYIYALHIFTLLLIGIGIGGLYKSAVIRPVE